MDLVSAATKAGLKSNLPDLQPGDRVKVHTRIVEGERERIQIFQGAVMRLGKGKGANGRFTVRRIATHGIGVERTFLINSPRVEKIEVAGHAHVRRAQLYYLRGRARQSRTLERKTRSGSAAEAEAPTEA